MRCHRTMVSTSVLSWDGGVRVIGNSTDCGTLWDMLAYNHRQNKKRDEDMPEKDKKIGDLRQQTGDLKRSASQMEMDFFNKKKIGGHVRPRLALSTTRRRTRLASLDTAEVITTRPVPIGCGRPALSVFFFWIFFC